jgi:Uma2 family endonuclease
MFLDPENVAMATAMKEPPAVIEDLTLQDLVDRLGGIPLSRILAKPAPGTATEADLLAVNASKRHLCELADGVLVEKAMGLRESLLAGALIGLIRAFVIPRKLGLVSGEAGTLQLVSGLVRIPDVAFISWGRFPGGRVPEESMPRISPDLVIEILSKGNTKAEMNRKRRDYFQARVDVVWEVDPKKRTIAVYHRDKSKPVVYDQSQTIECGGTLAGFRLVLADLFAELDEELAKPKNP